ncbi:unnamed protein product [Cuscuta epithymum]|uniref:Uncharacterized protein n=1 Tax=Cuscuta epithymum TaxID=186058 RepID=A0AAV0E9Z1_9ASTE|nr:unnamed protein product [Cuscuta epithymum]
MFYFYLGKRSMFTPIKTYFSCHLKKQVQHMNLVSMFHKQASHLIVDEITKLNSSRPQSWPTTIYYTIGCTRIEPSCFQLAKHYPWQGRLPLDVRYRHPFADKLTRYKNLSFVFFLSKKLSQLEL